MATSYINTLEGLLGNSHIGDWSGNRSNLQHFRLARTMPPQVQADGKEKSFSDTEKWQFWPRSMAMGSSQGSKFYQVSFLVAFTSRGAGVS